MCQTNAAAAMKAVDSLLWYCCTCIALRVLRFATQFVTLLAALTAFVTAAIVSFTPLRSFLPSFHFITPRSQPIHLLQGWASHTNTTEARHNGNAPAFRKPALQYSPGSISLHYVIHSLQ